MDNLRLAEIQIRTLTINGRFNASEDELKDFITELFIELSIQHKQHQRTNDLLEGLVRNISLAEITNNEEE